MQKVGAKPCGALAGYIGKDSESGDRFLVKFVETPEHAANEVLAAHLYRSAGVCVPDIRRGRVRKSGGKTGPMGDAILSPWPWIYTLEQQAAGGDAGLDRDAERGREAIARDELPRRRVAWRVGRGRPQGRQLAEEHGR